jgi:hypothetical protein
MALNLTVIFGSVRSVRRGIRAVRYLERAFAERGHTVTTVDPVEYRLPLLDKMYKEYPKGFAAFVSRLCPLSTRNTKTEELRVRRGLRVFAMSCRC